MEEVSVLRVITTVVSTVCSFVSLGYAICAWRAGRATDRVVEEIENCLEGAKNEREGDQGNDEERE